MVTNTLGAALRAILVWILVITPSVILTGVLGENSMMVVSFVFLAALFTFVEYFFKTLLLSNSALLLRLTAIAM